jgi:xanthine dehydrogenase accessory factor
MFEDVRVLIKGAGDLATGVAARLWRCGFPVAMTELAQPLTIRRTVAFSQAVCSGEVTVEEITACLAPNLEAVALAWQANRIPVVSDCNETCIASIKPTVVVDAIIAKRNCGTYLSDAPFVVGLGPGFEAGKDVHAVVETNRGHYLGRVLWSGSAQPDTGVPGDIAGYGRDRVIYAPGEGIFHQVMDIGSAVQVGDIVGRVGQAPVLAPLSGILRGLLQDGIPVQAGLKIGDVDPRAALDHCYTISEKALAIGGGVLEAILIYLKGER